MRPILLLALLAACAHRGPDAPLTPEACERTIVETLALPELEGRGLGTRGKLIAAGHVERWLRSVGAEPVDGAYRQRFEAVTGVEVGEGTGLADATGPLAVGEDVAPFAFSSDGAFDGEVVFAGYGIRAPALGYDDYDGLDVAGKVVLAMRYEPGEDDPDSAFDGRRPSRHSDLRRKALEARERGAAALVLVAPAREADEPDKVPALVPGRGRESRSGIPVVQVTRAVAERWLAAAGTSLAAERAAIDAGPAPRSRALPGVRVAGEVRLDTTRALVDNLVGLLPGAGRLADEVVVIGAHYDHLGYGEHGSMRPGERAVHPGADDNASGVAVMLCALRTLRDDPSPDRRAVLAVAFGAEEVGLVGSSHYVANPAWPLADTVAMVNLDMVGHLGDRPLQALGSDSSPDWPEILWTAAPLDLQLRTGGDGYGPSDHMTFYERGVPVVHLFTGAHERYHTPDDVAASVDMDGVARVTRYVDGLVRLLRTREDRLPYFHSPSGAPLLGDSRGHGAWLGTVPDYTAMTATEGGVKLSGVRAGGPADHAGVRAGDVLVGLAGIGIQNLHDMTFALRDHRPGETVDVVVLRGGERLTLRATLGDRSKIGDAGGTHGGPVTAEPVRPAHALCGGEAPPGGDWRACVPDWGPGAGWRPAAGQPAPELLRWEERPFLTDLRRLTFGGENAEAYWSPDGRRLIFQRTPPEGGCDQQLLLDLDTGASSRVSSGRGRTTCGYFDWPAGETVIYATTEGASAACPAPPDRSQGYVWPLYDTFDIVRHAPGAPPEVLIGQPGAYDAEATVCMRDGRIVFTSDRDGDLELYLAEADGSGVRRLTHTPGYDGGAFFTPDCEHVVWRASRPEGADLADYRRLLAQGLVRPGALELFRMRLADGEVTQLTTLGAGSFGPYPHPTNDFLLFSSNAGASPREFDLYRVGWDGGEVTRVTHTEGFDGFPMFSPDGRWLVFASNRADPKGSETDLYLARWVGGP